VLLIPVSMLPSFTGMAGRTYLVAAVLLGMGLLGMAARLASVKMPVSSAVAKVRARQLLQSTIVYLPVLFALMMSNSRH